MIGDRKRLNSENASAVVMKILSWRFVLFISIVCLSSPAKYLLYFCKYLAYSYSITSKYKDVSQPSTAAWGFEMTCKCVGTFMSQVEPNWG